MARELQIRSNSVSVEVIRWVDDSNAQFLLLRRASALLNGQWCHIAGAVESGETAWQAAMRELREETGLEPIHLYSADFFEQFYRVDCDTLVLAPLFVAAVAPGATIRLNAEHSDYRWCSFSEAQSLLALPSQRACLAHVHAEFIQRVPHPLLQIAISNG